MESEIIFCIPREVFLSSCDLKENSTEQVKNGIKYMVIKESRYVYILTNPSFREDWMKIGKSSLPVDVWSKKFVSASILDNGI